MHGLRFEYEHGPKEGVVVVVARAEDDMGRTHVVREDVGELALDRDGDIRAKLGEAESSVA
jgi:hypothetical protein